MSEIESGPTDSTPTNDSTLTQSSFMNLLERQLKSSLKEAVEEALSKRKKVTPQEDLLCSDE